MPFTDQAGRSPIGEPDAGHDRASGRKWPRGEDMQVEGVSRAASGTGSRSGVKGRLRSLMLACLGGVGATVLLAPIYIFQGFGQARAVAAAALMAMPGALLVWGAWRFCRSLQRRPSAAPAVAHIGAALVFAFSWTAMVYLPVRLSNPAAARIFVTIWAPWQILDGLLLYAATAAIAQSMWAGQRLAEQKLATTRAELHALRAQLSPHFLFNALNSMIQLAEEDPRATQAALLRLAELLRHVTRNHNDDPGEVALEDELDFIRSYLALEGLRLGDRLRVIEEIDPDALEMSVPAFLLQPLVENAVAHGIASQRMGGTLRLGASLAGDNLLLEVSDDGAGCLLAAGEGRGGLGLDIVRRQLQIRFPQQSEMAVESEPGHGFSVRIALPARLSGTGVE